MTLPWKKGPPPEGEGGPCCAHVVVNYDPIHNENGTCSERWRCVACLCPFVPSHPQPITPPGEAPAPLSPREGGEGGEAKLRAFVQDVMGEWPHECGVDGFQLQDLAVKHGLLKPVTMTAPCGEGCQCAEYYESDELAEGVTCYRKTELLLPGEGT